MVDGGRDYLRYGWVKVKCKKIYWTEKQDGRYPGYDYTSVDRFPY